MRRIVPALTIAALLPIAACSSGGTDTPAPAPATATAAAATSSPTAPSSPNTYQFGQTHQDAIVTTVSAPVEFTTSNYAQPPNTKVWAVTIRYTNTLNTQFPVSVLVVDGYTNNVKSRAVFDGEYDGGLSAGSLAPGTSVEAKYAFTGTDRPRKVTVSSMDGSKTATFVE